MTDVPEDAKPPPVQPAVTATAQAVPAQAPPTRLKATLVLRLIAILAIFKCLLTLGAGMVVMDLSHHDVAETLNRWMRNLNLDPDADGPVHDAVAWLVKKMVGTSVGKLRLLGLLFYLYAGLYLAEAIGLWLERTWAEWLTIVVTGLLIPLEVDKLIEGPSIEVVLLFLLNVAVVAYLVVRVRRKLRLHHQHKLAEAAAAAAHAHGAARGESRTSAPAP